jgi:hypothetical protein
MRKILVRWDSPEGTATVCAERVGEHQLLPSHLVLYNVEGMAESSYPHVIVDTLAIKRDEISYMAEGNKEVVQESNSDQQPAPEHIQEKESPEAPVTELLQEEAEKPKLSKTKERRSRASRAASKS